MRPKESLLKPVVDVLSKEIYESKSGSNGLLIHTLSNGSNKLLLNILYANLPIITGGGFQFMTFASMVERIQS